MRHICLIHIYLEVLLMGIHSFDIVVAFSTRCWMQKNGTAKKRVKSMAGITKMMMMMMMMMMMTMIMMAKKERKITGKGC